MGLEQLAHAHCPFQTLPGLRAIVTMRPVSPLDWSPRRLHPARSSRQPERRVLFPTLTSTFHYEKRGTSGECFSDHPYIHHPKLYCHLASSWTLRSSIPLSTRQATSVFSMQFKEKCRHLYPPPYILQRVANSLECNIWLGCLSLKEYNIYK